MPSEKILHGLTLQEGIYLNSTIGAGNTKKTYQRLIEPTEVAKLVFKIYQADGNFNDFCIANQKKISEDLLKMFYKLHLLPEEIKIMMSFGGRGKSIIPIYEGTRYMPRLKKPSEQILLAKTWGEKKLTRDNVLSIVSRVESGLSMEKAIEKVEEMDPKPVVHFLHVGLLEKEIQIILDNNELLIRLGEFLFSENCIKNKEDLIAFRIDKKTYILMLKTQDKKRPKFPAKLSKILTKFLIDLDLST